MALALYSCLVHQHTRIRGEAGKGHQNVVINNTDLADSPRVLQLGGGPLLHAEDDNVLAANSNLRHREGHTVIAVSRVRVALTLVGCPCTESSFQ